MKIRVLITSVFSGWSLLLLLALGSIAYIGLDTAGAMGYFFR